MAKKKYPNNRERARLFAAKHRNLVAKRLCLWIKGAFWPNAYIEPTASLDDDIADAVAELERLQALVDMAAKQ